MSDEPDADVLHEETAVVRRPQPNHSALQQQKTEAAVAEHTLRSTGLADAQRDEDLGLGEFRGDFWNAAPDPHVSAPRDAEPVVFRPQGRRLIAALVFLVAFSGVLLLLLAEGVAWLWQRW
ncbi:MAG: hypothetical protein ACOY0T_00685 [Myxococcota bacterium]